MESSKSDLEATYMPLPAVRTARDLRVRTSCDAVKMSEHCLNLTRSVSAGSPTHPWSPRRRWREVCSVPISRRVPRTRRFANSRTESNHEISKTGDWRELAPGVWSRLQIEERECPRSARSESRIAQTRCVPGGSTNATPASRATVADRIQDFVGGRPNEVRR